MTRYVAFLRGINVGGHKVKMPALRGHFEDLGFGAVETFIASGNVIFDAGDSGASDGAVRKLEERIEGALRAALGYDVATFLRSDAEVARIAAHDPFADDPSRDGDTRYVVFLRGAPDAAARKRLAALSNDQDVLRLDGRELYWLRRGGLLQSTISDISFGQAVGKMPVTMRNLNTLRRLAAKVTPAPP